MKKGVLFILLFLTPFCYGQTLISENFDRTPLIEVFDLFKEKYNIKISYDPDLIETVTISANLDKLTIEAAIKQVLENTELSYNRVRADYYSIIPSKTIWDLAGEIKDETGAAVPYARIRILGTYKGVYANDNGAFSFIYRSDKTPMLEISSMGFEKIIISATDIKAGATINMKPQTIAFKEVMVEYLSEGIATSDDISSISVNTKKIGAVPGTTEPDIFQLVQNIPGINSSTSTVSQIQIRGGTADQNHIIWDGIPIYHPGHFNGMISSVNPNIIDHTDLHRGIYDPYYGGKASGLISLNSINHVPEKLEAGGGINMMQGDAYVKTPITSKGALLISGRRSYMDLWKSPTYKRYSDRVYQETEIMSSGIYVNDPEFSDEPGELLEVTNDFVYYDINGKLIFKPGENQLITASAILTRNQLDYSSNLTDEENITNYITSANHGINLTYKNKWSEKWQSSFLGSFARYNSFFEYQLREIDDDDPFEQRLSKTNLVNHFLFKWNNQYQYNEQHTFSAGYQAHANRVDYELIAQEEEEDTISEIGSIKGITNVLHANHTYKKGRWLTRSGIRFSHFTATGSVYTEPRLYAQYALTDWLKVKASTGIQNQFISQVDEFDETYLGLTNRIWVMADNEDVPVINSRILNTGAVIQHKGWYIGIDAYLKQIQGIVNFSENPAAASGLIRGDATAKGIDLLVKKRWKNYRSWISYTLSDVTFHFTDIVEESFPASFNQRHTLKWVNTLNWQQFEFSTAFKIASGNPYTPVTGIKETINEDPEEEELDVDYDLEYGARNSQTLPVFHQLDLTVFYNFPKNPDKNWKGKVGVSCFNVYNRTNILSRTYDLDIYEDEETGEITPEYYVIDKFYLKITPNLLVRFEF